MYVSVTLRNPIISRATRKRSITCASVTLRNVTAAPAIAIREESGDEVFFLTIVRDVGDAVRTQRSGGQPEYEPIRAACNRLAQLSTCTSYLLQRRCESSARRVRSTQTFAARVTLLHMRISSIYICCASSGEKGIMEDVKRDKGVHKVDGHTHKNKSTYRLLLCR